MFVLSSGDLDINQCCQIGQGMHQVPHTGIKLIGARFLRFSSSKHSHPQFCQFQTLLTTIRPDEHCLLPIGRRPSSRGREERKLSSYLIVV
jgi:hypothetical protein